MNRVTVSGAGGSCNFVNSDPDGTRRQLSLSLAVEAEMMAYRAYRCVSHHFRRHNSADAAVDHDAAERAWHDARELRDTHERLNDN